ncbi:SURP and G-patch domain-containing protein 1-like protein [Hirschfeldia incana]|nr:SURP and G-patch domain-containing protein 1-like protein [Hirschfeldia incana]
MDKGAPPPPPPSIFVNDGSFMERFRQLQQEKDEVKDKVVPHVVEESKPVKIITGISNPRPSSSSSSSATKTSIAFKTNDAQKKGGKLAFSLKQKSKLLAPPVKLGEEEDEDEGDADIIDQRFGSAKRPKLEQGRDTTPAKSTKVSDVAPPAPSDPTVKNAADKLASFVAKNGRAFENVTRQKNPGDSLFKFLFDESCADYKYYAFRLSEEEKSISQAKESGALYSGDGPRMSTASITSQKPAQQQRGYQTPASALYDASVESGASSRSQASVTRPNNGDSYSAPRAADPISMMEFYMKKAAQEEKMRRPRQSNDEMPPPASLQGSSAIPSTDSGKRGHHMGDYIPPEELDKFLAKCDDVAAVKATKEAAEKAKIQADNVGHKLLSKMGWKEGEGIGSSRKGMADPIMAGDVKTNNLGVGASAPGEVNPEDDIYEQYKKRMMLGYKHRPNPLGNPRKAYY